jgi:hypothetical protein
VKIPALITTVFLIVTYIYRLNYSLWYDEAAVVENARNLSILDYIDGLNWLQSIPIGYFLIAKLVLNLSFGVELLRIISLLFFILGSVIAVRFIFGKPINSILGLPLLLVLLINPISITYATMVKPYALEFLLGMTALALYKYRQFRTLIFLGLLGPLFSNTFFIMHLCIGAAILLFHRKYWYALFVGVSSLFTQLITLQITSSKTRQIMNEVWFGGEIHTGFRTLRMALGNIGWLPVSGLGIIPEAGGSRSYLIVSLTILTLLFFFVVGQRDELRLVLVLNFAAFIVGQTLLLFPAAGRLMLSTAGLIWILIFLRLSTFTKGIQKSISWTLVSIVTFSALVSRVAINPVGNSSIKSAVSYLPESATPDNLYTNLWSGPATYFYLNELKDRFNPNTVWLENNLGLTGCTEGDLKINDVIVLDNVTTPLNIPDKQIGSFEIFYEDRSSALIRVIQPLKLEKTPTFGNDLSCRYNSRNPNLPRES